MQEIDATTVGDEVPFEGGDLVDDGEIDFSDSEPIDMFVDAADDAPDDTSQAVAMTLGSDRRALLDPKVVPRRSGEEMCPVCFLIVRGSNVNADGVCVDCC